MKKLTICLLLLLAALLLNGCASTTTNNNFTAQGDIKCTILSTVDKPVTTQTDLLRDALRDAAVQPNMPTQGGTVTNPTQTKN
jgi:PBP1b-binding outer membrane lipoprotein LpoB